jgi:hypothetical protein
MLPLHHLLTAAAVAFLGLAAGAIPAVAADSPLSCAFDGNITIECDVYADTARIDDISVNRGRCQPPLALKAIRFYLDLNQSPIDAGVLTAEERALFERVDRKGLNIAMDRATQAGLLTDSATLMGLGALALLEPMLTAKGAGDTATAVELASAIFALGDPTYPDAEVQFGDTLRFNTVGCANLLEYSITVDGTEWVWDAKGAE